MKPTELFQRKQSTAEKKHSAEFAAVTANLQRYLSRINAGENPSVLKAGFVHPERVGIKAISQQGKLGKNTRAYRLYIYPDTATNTLHLLTLGDKGTQSDDIKDCIALLKFIRKGAKPPS
ncbi:MAG: hypothetical protein WC360_01130 [Opitutales bacterium]